MTCLNRVIILVVVLLCIFVHSGSLYAEELTVIGYNVESGGAQSNAVGQRISHIDGCDVWGLSEVQNASWAQQFEDAAEQGEGPNANFERVIGTTGGADKLLIIYDNKRFEKINDFELTHINVGGRVRAPLVAHLRERDSGQEFLFMVNHLYRSRSGQRHLQARMLNQWARQQTLPIIAVGDYNFDWDVEDGDTDHDEGYDEMIGGGIFTWVRPPPPLKKTHCSTRFNSVLDFVFVAGDAKGWGGTSEILVAPGDCPDDNQTSDHRPVKAVFQLPNGAPQPTADAERLQEVLERLRQLEEEVRQLRELVEELTGE